MIDPGGPASLGREKSGTGEPEISWLRPSPLLLRARRIEVAAVTVPAAIAGGLAGQLASAAVGITMPAGLVLAGLLAERFLARRVASWGYAERKDDLMVRRGVLIRRLSVIPYGRMQFIDVPG